MPRVRFTLPQVKIRPDCRPSKCPRCGCGVLREHGEVQQPIEDIRVDAVMALRFLCADCGRAFRHYPQGVDRRDQSQRLTFAALSWALGLSLRSATHTLTALGCDMSRMSVWRAAREAGTSALSGLARSAPGRVRVIGADETFMKLRGEEAVVGFVANAESGQLLGMDVLTRRDPAAFVEWLSGCMSKFGVGSAANDIFRRTSRRSKSTERAICSGKVRHKTARGYKSESGMMNGLGLAQWMWSGHRLDATELMAA